MANQITEASLKAVLTERLQAIHVEITDMSAHRIAAEQYIHGDSFTYSTSMYNRIRVLDTDIFATLPGGCGQAFTSTIVSPVFEKQTSLKRHRLVNAALKDEIAQIHAWSAKCQTPAEWERDRAAAGGANEGPPMDGTVGGRVEGVAQ
ncbi:bolA domain-containing protein [Colletotrichum tofieldiae]|nr:BolA domain-containing protein [Colletotrichum tofieldiae]GKT79360.1 bolA domain-containing protein [Colletotrichum tofieldiae]